MRCGSTSPASVRATMQGGPVRCGNFLAEEYSADAVLENGELTLRRLSLRPPLPLADVRAMLGIDPPEVAHPEGVMVATREDLSPTEKARLSRALGAV